MECNVAHSAHLFGAHKFSPQPRSDLVRNTEAMRMTQHLEGGKTDIRILLLERGVEVGRSPDDVRTKPGVGNSCAVKVGRAKVARR